MSNDMKRLLTIALLCAFATLSTWGSPVASQSAPNQRHVRKEDTYTITSVMQSVGPVNVADMNDEFQDARLLVHDGDSSLVEVTYYPLYRSEIDEDPNWRKNDAGMTNYLTPTVTENWDETMRRDLVAELRKSSIAPDSLTEGIGKYIE